MTFLRFLLDGHEGLLIDVPGVAARYLRLYGNGNTESDLNHCTEVEVYGRRSNPAARTKVRVR